PVHSAVACPEECCRLRTALSRAHYAVACALCRHMHTVPSHAHCAVVCTLCCALHIRRAGLLLTKNTPADQLRWNWRGWLSLKLFQMLALDCAGSAQTRPR